MSIPCSGPGNGHFPKDPRKVLETQTSVLDMLITAGLRLRSGPFRGQSLRTHVFTFVLYKDTFWLLLSICVYFKLNKASDQCLPFESSLFLLTPDFPFFEDSYSLKHFDLYHYIEIEALSLFCLFLVNGKEMFAVY